MLTSQVIITGIAHIYITVSDMSISECFYDPLMKFLGFKKSSGPLAGGDYHVHYFNKVTQYTIRPAKKVFPKHDPFSPGLHHVCFWVESKEEVDRAAEGLNRLSIEVSEPQLYPQYELDYYATFLQDPDGIQLEIRSFGQLRQETVTYWDEIPWESP